MEIVTIQAEPRATVRKRLGRLRREGKLPGVMYGSQTGSVPIQLEAHEAGLVLNRLHGTVLIDLKLNGEVHKTVVRDVQRDVLRGDLLHVDFLKVAMDRTIVTTVPVEIVGEAPILEQGDYMIVTLLTEVEIECLPGNLINNIEVSAEDLAHPHDAITVGDLFAPKGVAILTDAREVVARVAYASRVGAEEEAIPEFDAEAVEVVERARAEAESEEESEAGED